MMDCQTRTQRILIVDDETINIKVLAAALKPDYLITFALDGAAALKMAVESESPDLILLDIMMPEMDGFEVCRRLKQDRRTRHIPVIFITARSEVADETRGLSCGAVDYITKPFSMPIVKARIKTHLELKRHRDLLMELSSRDGLTGIPNRRRFDEHLSLEWRRAVREGTPLSLVMIDIDHFKLYNDTYGHCLGDDSLRKVAAVLNNAVNRPSDLVARYGGEEFAAILPRTDRNGAVCIAEQMRGGVARLQIPHTHSHPMPFLTISLGVATTLPNEYEDPGVLVRAGDRSLYDAKRNGRNQVCSMGVG